MCAVDKEETGPWRQRAVSVDTSGRMRGAMLERWPATVAAVVPWADGSEPAGCDAPRATDGDGVRADFLLCNPGGSPLQRFGRYARPARDLNRQDNWPMLVPLAATFGASFLLCILQTPIARSLAIKWELVDRPDQRRKMHPRTVPVAGGPSVPVSNRAANVLILA